MTSNEAPVRFTVVGTGWRARFFLRIAQLLPDSHVVASVVTRRPDDFDRSLVAPDTPVVSDLTEGIRAGDPDFVIVSVPRDVAPAIIERCVDLGHAVLTETPPAPDLAGLRQLWQDVGASDLVQVAEQYPRYPGHVARRAVVEAGTIGTPYDAQVSSTHDYHAVAMIRGFLGLPALGSGPVTVTAHRSTQRLADPQARGGWTGDGREVDAEQLRVHLDLGDGRTGLYDFTSNQWHNPLRQRRVVVRGSLGEIVDDRVVHLVDEQTVVTSELGRRELGIDLELEGRTVDHVQFDGRVVFRNPWQSAPLMDDEVATASLLHDTGRWAQGLGEPSYPLREGLQDHAVGLAMHESAERGRPVTVEPDVWTR